MKTKAIERIPEDRDRRAETADLSASAGDRRPLRHELRTLLALAGPIVVSQLGTVGMNTVDTLMVGPLGAEALAAAGVGTAIHNTVLMISFGVLIGMSPLVSQAHGAGDVDRSRRVLVQGLWLALALSVVVAGVSLAGTRVALLLGQDPAVAELAGRYMIALAPGAAPMLLFLAARVYLEGLGIARAPMLVMLLALGLNVPMNWILIYGVEGWIPPLGVEGAGWATTIVRGSMLLAVLGFFLRRSELRPAPAAGWRLEPSLLRQIVRVGAPIGGQLGLEVGIFALAAIMMGWFSPTALAAHQVTINIAATTFMVGLGASMAGSVRVGYHIGAGSRDGVRQAVIGTYLLALGFMGTCALVFLAAPEALIGLYTRDPEIVALGASLLIVAAFFQLLDAGQTAGINLLRGAADTRTPMILAAVGYWGAGLPIAYGLGFHTPLGPRGVWIGLALALGIVAALMGRRVRNVLWHGAFSRAEG